MAVSTPTAQRDALLADLESLWACIGELMDAIQPAEWSRRHGKDWTVAEVPYHLSYFDREIVALPLEQGAAVPAAERMLLRTERELNAWNAARFAERPAHQTPAESVKQMRASRDAIRRVVRSLDDADLERQAWMPLVVGWSTARMALEACRAHTWSHFEQLRLHMKRSGPAPSPAAVHGALAFYAAFLCMTLDRERAATADFTLVMDITGAGGGEWTIHVDHGACTLTEGRAARADLVMTQSPETFIKTMNRMHNPMAAMLTRKVKVRGLHRMGTFAKLFPQPKPDTVLGAPTA